MDKIPKLFTLNTLCTVVIISFIAITIAACNASGVVTPANNNTKLLVVNTSPDAGPIQAFLNNIQLGNSTAALANRTYFKFLVAPTYNSVGTGSITLQLKTDHQVNLTTDTVTITGNVNYSIFLTGLLSVDSLKTIFLIDTAALPALGRGKVRFLNASPRSSAMDLYINGTKGFSSVAYTKATKFIEVPAGIYSFVITPAGSTTNTILTLPSITIQDGRLYTLYTKGLIGRVDSAAISLNIVANK